MRHQVRHSSSNALDCQIDAQDCRILLVTTSGTRSDGNFVGFLKAQQFTVIQLWMISLCERGVDLLGFGSVDALTNHKLDPKY